ncbi:hypothetical protein FQR65_LT15432 [Abscondita terminalis]|nr:hypothetical protein FQR65_LT15432 [Abscondita terminalis]
MEVKISLKKVKRKGGWDTHGLPIELAVEKTLGITKEDIGKKISVEEYNAACRKEVMKYTDVWNDLTIKMGYWQSLPAKSWSAYAMNNYCLIITSEELQEKAFRVIPGDFVTTEDGTGIVHAAPTYGADDFRVARENDVPGILVKDENETLDLHRPYVDDIVLVSDGGQKLFREPDLIDVWFDSGAMPYANGDWITTSWLVVKNTRSKRALNPHSLQISLLRVSIRPADGSLPFMPFLQCYEKVRKSKGSSFFLRQYKRYMRLFTDTTGIIKKKIKPNFKALGSKVGKDMKLVTTAINNLTPELISALEKEGSIALADTPYTITTEDVEIIAEDVEGWQVANLGKLTVALDVHITEALKKEGLVP